MLPLLALVGLAHAAPRTVCVQAATSYDDADVGGGEDYYASNANRRLRGAILYFKKTTASAYYSTYVDFGGSAPGCVTLDLTASALYDFKVASHASVDGHYIDVVASFSDNLYEASFSNQFLPAGQVKFLTVGPHRAWNVLAASAFALHRRDGGLTNYDVVFEVPIDTGVLFAPSGCFGSSCVVGTTIYLDDDDVNRKFAVTRAMGRSFLNHLGLQAIDVSTTYDTVECSPAGGVALHSIEHDSAAVVEAYGWLYAATVFNKTNQTDCSLTNPVAADWDMQGGICYEEEESPVGHVMSCAEGPSMVPKVNQRHYCDVRVVGSTMDDGTSIGLDWLRYLWELQTGSTTFTDITNAYDAALGSSSWTPSGVGVRDALFTGGLYPSPAAQLSSSRHGVEQ